VALSEEQRKQLDQLRLAIGSAAFQPPDIKEMAERFETGWAELKPLLSYLIDLGEIVLVSGEFYFARARMDEARDKLRELFAARPELQLSEIKEALATSRKYAVPLAGHFDALGWTTRNGVLRRPGPKLGKADDE
jgi:selenocysteine-specific elongation factor